ncbi:MAG: 50S ribosomal protein L13 [Elusimicrobia bacterium CG06_land_8_20_14_3_00_38_11]|nr:MAG: 50S ribosomal protein L13 [Elusimicrobia bacterium CG06_land_8_20_14_3_00_38_11]
MVERKWYWIDANGEVLGRLSTVAVGILQGKTKPEYSPNSDIGDFVLVTNAAKVKMTGNKLEQKLDYRHSGYPGGDKYILYKDLMLTDPEKIIKLSISGMLPKNRLRTKRLRRLKIYKNDAKQLEAKCQKIQVNSSRQ